MSLRWSFALAHWLSTNMSSPRDWERHEPRLPVSMLRTPFRSPEQGHRAERLFVPGLEEKVEIYFRADGWKRASVIQRFEAQNLPSKRDVKNALQLSSNRNLSVESHRFYLPTEISRQLHTVLCAKQIFLGRNTPISPPNRNFSSVARDTLCQTDFSR